MQLQVLDRMPLSTALERLSGILRIVKGGRKGNNRPRCTFTSNPHWGLLLHLLLLHYSSLVLGREMSVPPRLALIIGFFVWSVRSNAVVSPIIDVTPGASGKVWRRGQVPSEGFFDPRDNHGSMLTVRVFSLTRPRTTYTYAYVFAEVWVSDNVLVC